MKRTKKRKPPILYVAEVTGVFVKVISFIDRNSAKNQSFVLIAFHN